MTDYEINAATQQLEYRMAVPPKPHSVSRAAWPYLFKLGEMRKTRIFSQETYVDASQPGRLTASSGVVVFNRISDAMPNGIYAPSGREELGNRARLHVPMGWFDLNNPAVVGHSSEGLVPCSANLVFLSEQQVHDVLKSAVNSFGIKGKVGDNFAVENALIARGHKIASEHARTEEGAKPPRALFEQLADLSRAFGMPRLNAYATDELTCLDNKGISRMQAGAQRLLLG